VGVSGFMLSLAAPTVSPVARRAGLGFDFSSSAYCQSLPGQTCFDQQLRILYPGSPGATYQSCQLINGVGDALGFVNVGSPPLSFTFATNGYLYIGDDFVCGDTFEVEFSDGTTLGVTSCPNCAALPVTTDNYSRQCWDLAAGSYTINVRHANPQINGTKTLNGGSWIQVGQHSCAQLAATPALQPFSYSVLCAGGVICNHLKILGTIEPCGELCEPVGVE